MAPETGDRNSNPAFPPKCYVPQATILISLVSTVWTAVRDPIDLALTFSETKIPEFPHVSAPFPSFLMPLVSTPKEATGLSGMSSPCQDSQNASTFHSNPRFPMGHGSNPTLIWHSCSFFFSLNWYTAGL